MQVKAKIQLPHTIAAEVTDIHQHAWQGVRTYIVISTAKDIIHSYYVQNVFSLDEPLIATSLCTSKLDSRFRIRAEDVQYMLRCALEGRVASELWTLPTNRLSTCEGIPSESLSRGTLVIIFRIKTCAHTQACMSLRRRVRRHRPPKRCDYSGDCACAFLAVGIFMDTC